MAMRDSKKQTDLYIGSSLLPGYPPGCFADIGVFVGSIPTPQSGSEAPCRIEKWAADFLLPHASGVIEAFWPSVVSLND